MPAAARGAIATWSDAGRARTPRMGVSLKSIEEVAGLAFLGPRSSGGAARSGHLVSFAAGVGAAPADVHESAQIGTRPGSLGGNLGKESV